MGVAAQHSGRLQTVVGGLAVVMLTTCMVVFWRQGGTCEGQSAAASILRAWQAGEPAGGNSGAASEASCPTREEVAASDWAKSCNVVNNVCVDQGVMVLYEDRYQPARGGAAGGGQKLPSFVAENNYGQYIYMYRNGWGEYKYPLPTIRGRAASMNEGTPYLKDPVFSNCTVPVVWYPFWMTNFGHFFRDNAAKLFGFLQDTPWADSIKLVPVTAEGLALPGFNYQLLQPMSKLRVETWADFTTRLGPGSRLLVPPGPPPSSEGDHQRCFQSMLVCTHGLDINRWPLHGYGRHVVQSYRHLLPPEVQALSDTPSSVLRPPPKDGGPTVLNVVFQKRPGDGRQLLNIQQLLQLCNAWQHRIAKGRRSFRAKCWEAEITDLASGLLASQQADVFVGVHGANLANGWMMRPGSSMIEVQPYGFDAHLPHLQDPLFNAEDTETQVLWWVLQGCDPGAWRPSSAEAEGKGVPANWPKNRNMILRWEALEAALQQVVETGGSMDRYWELWERGEWWWHVHAGNVTYGGDYHNVCSVSPNQAA